MPAPVALTTCDPDPCSPPSEQGCRGEGPQRQGKHRERPHTSSTSPGSSEGVTVRLPSQNEEPRGPWGSGGEGEPGRGEGVLGRGGSRGAHMGQEEGS